MAISIQLNTPNALIGIAKAAGCPAWGQQLDSVGVTIDLQPKQIILRHNGHIIAMAPANTSAVKLLLEDNLQQASKMILSDKLTDLYKTAVEKLKEQGQITYIPDKASDLSKVSPPNQSKSYVVEDEDSIPTQPPVGNLAGKGSKSHPLGKDYAIKLAQASKVGQPVKATSAGSVYHVVAVSKSVNAAARMNVDSAGNWKLSLRFEGSALHTVVSHMTEIGASPGDGYYSLHLHGEGGSPMASRALGAVLMGAPFGWDSLMTSPNSLINAGA